MARKVPVEENDARKIYAIACDDGSLIIQFRYLDGNGHVFHAYSENVSARGAMVLRAELDRGQPNTGLQADLCETCGGAEMIREWGEWVDCPACHPAQAAKA
jgi:hypothetical protein